MGIQPFPKRLPQRRKTPVRHHVRQHQRKGRFVTAYLRGNGPPVTFIRKKTLSHEDFSRSHEPRQYTVTAKYADGKKEMVKTIAHSPEEAIHFGLLKMKRRDERPVEIVVKNLLGDIVGKIAAWGVGGLKKMAQTYKLTRAQSKAAEEAKAAEIKRLQQRGAELPVPPE